MTGTASILPRTVAALAALLLAAGLFAWMNATGDGVARVSDTLRNHAKANELVWSWIGQAKASRDATQVEALPQATDEEPVPETSTSWAASAFEEEAEEVENPFGCSHCDGFYGMYWIDWGVWRRGLTAFFLFGALSAFLAVNRGLLRRR